MFLLLLLCAAQSFRWSRWAEVRRTVASARGAAETSGTTGPRATEAPAASWSRSTKAAARSRSTKAAPAGTARSRTAEATAWTRRRPIFAGACLTDRKVAAHERLSVKPLDDFLSDGTVGELDKRKSARTTGFAVDRHDDVRWFSDGSEVTAEVCLCRAVRQVSDKQTN